MRWSAELRAWLRPPGIPRRARVVERGDRRVVQSEELGIGRSGLEPVRLNQPQHPHRVVRGGAPQRVVEAAEDRPRVGMPAPPQVDGQFIEPRNPWRQWSPACVSAHQGVGNANADLRSPTKPRACGIGWERGTARHPDRSCAVTEPSTTVSSRVRPKRRNYAFVC